MTFSLIFVFCILYCVGLQDELDEVGKAGSSIGISGPPPVRHNDSVDRTYDLF